MVLRSSRQLYSSFPGCQVPMGISREEIHADYSALRNSGFLRFRSADNFALAGRPFGVGSRVAFPLRSDVQRMVRWSGPGISSSRLVGYCFLLQLSSSGLLVR